MIRKGRWAEKLPGVFLAYRTSPRWPTGETHFSLVHGVESVVPIEHEVQALRMMRAHQNESENDQSLCDALDLVDEKREHALVRLSQYRQSIAKFYNKNISARKFKVGNLVLRKELNAGKLGANWEGPYWVTQVVLPGVYELETMGWTHVLRSWNVINLQNNYC